MTFASEIVARAMALVPQTQAARLWIREGGSFFCRAAVGGLPEDENRRVSGEEIESLIGAPRLTAALRRGGEILGYLSLERTDGAVGGQAEPILQLVADWAASSMEALNLAETIRSQRQEQELLASAFSHDLKSPLILIANYAALLQQKLGTAERGELLQYLDRLRSGVRRAESLAKDLTAYLRLGHSATQKRVISLGDVVADVRALLLPLIEEKKARLDVGDLPRVRADRSKLEAVLLNLIENALRYTGEIRPPHVSVFARSEESVWRIEVEDKGPGIPAELLPALFKLFSRLPEGQRLEPGGTGVGLAIVRRIVEDHGGKVGVASTVGLGSTFWFTLPRS